MHVSGSEVKMRTFLLFCVGLVAVAAVPKNQHKIVGGSITTISQYPQMAALLYTWDLSTYWQSCGGTILNTRNILTAAHCIIGDAAYLWRVRVGSTYANSGGAVHGTANWILHPNYNDDTIDNDIAILRTSSTITYINNAVQAGTIAGSNYILPDNAIVWTTGWGSISWGSAPSEILRHVQVWVTNQATCTARYSEIGLTVTANMLCAGWLDVGGRDACQGDSGGPLFHNNIIVGVTSWGELCAHPHYPGVYARVSSASNWIQANA